VGVGVAVGVGVVDGVGVGFTDEGTHCENLKLPMRVRQGAPGASVPCCASGLKYSLTYQKVQSSVGSTVREE
jgi:hypothetical protein